MNYSGGSYHSFKIYNAKFWDSQSTIRNFIPCQSKSAVTNIDNIQCPSGTIGMYDTVEGKFYTNQGKGNDFIAGNAI